MKQALDFLKSNKDVALAISHLFWATASAQQPRNMENSHEYIDLGLSVKWAGWQMAYSHCRRMERAVGQLYK